ncbi:hypothetical protein [Desulfocastanea catecholica]
METGNIWAGMAMVIKSMDGSEFGYLLVALMMPPILIFVALFLLREEIRRREAADRERFEAMAQMYKNNVVVAEQSQKTADGLQTVIHLSTSTLTRLVEKINNNHFCPIVRERSNSDGSGI